MISLTATVADTRRVAAGVTLLRLHAPDIALACRPGQFVMARGSDGCDPYLRRALPIFTASNPFIALLVRADEPGRRWLAHQGVGQPIDLLGPLGQGFVLTPTTRHLLLVAEGMGVAALGAIAAVAAEKGIAVTLLAGAPSAGAALPADILPIDVEYQLATADGCRGAEAGDSASEEELPPARSGPTGAGTPVGTHQLLPPISMSPPT